MKVLIVGGNPSLQRSIAVSGLDAGHDVLVATLPEEAPGPSLPARVAPVSLATVGPSDELQVDAAIILDRSLTGSRHGSPEVPDEQVHTALNRAKRAIVVVAAHATDDRSAALENAARAAGDWLVIRTAPIYGIAEDPVSLFLIMMRSLPAVPVLSDSFAIRPVWHEDLAYAVIGAIGMPSTSMNRAVDIGGPEAVTQDDLYARIAALIDRRPARLPVPDFLATHGTRLTEALKLSLPFDASHLAFAASSSPTGKEVESAPAPFEITFTGLDEGLRRCIRELDETLPAERVGRLEVKRFHTTITGTAYDAEELLRLFRTSFADVMPIQVGVEPVAPNVELIAGSVVTMNLPGRGHVQIRVEEVGPRHVIVATLRGHVLAGIVRFSTSDVPKGVEFAVTTCDAAANAFDWIALTLGGARVQDANWARVVQNVVKLSAGESDGVHHDARKLTEDEAADAERWIATIVSRQRNEVPAAGGTEA
jgi:NADH dehydrogenase